MTAKKEGNLQWVEGLRGIASTLVWITHVSRAFDYDLYSPTSGEGSRPRLLQLPFLRILIQGRLGVIIFIYVTGYVCALKPLGLFRQGNYEEGWASISKSTLRRLPRLAYPSIMATTISWAVAQLGLYQVAKQTDSYYLSQTAPEKLPILSAMRNLFINIVNTWTGAGNKYDVHQGTLFVLLKGGVFVLLFISATAKVRSQFRMGAALVVWGYYWYCAEPYFMQFWWGVLMNDLHNSRLLLRMSRVESGFLLVLASLFMITGLYIASYPESNIERATWSHWQHRIFSMILPKESEFPKFASGLGFDLTTGLREELDPSNILFQEFIGSKALKAFQVNLGGAPIMTPTLVSQSPLKLHNHVLLRARGPSQVRLLRRVCLCAATAMLILLWLPMGLPINIQKPHLAQYYPPSLQSPQAISQGRFPRKIWQTWNHIPPFFEKREMERVRSWTESNPEWRWEVLTNANELEYVEDHFGPRGFNRPDIVEFFRTVNSKIVKSDLLRYLIIYVEGGLYADIDVEALKPIHEFIPDGFDEADIDLVIGIEADEPTFKDHPILGLVSRSFCQWTFLCKPQLPLMIGMVDSAMARIHKLAKEQGVPISEVKIDFYQVIGSSGPRLFTDVIMQYMDENRSRDSPITWDDFHQIDEATLVSRVLVLPVQAFAAAQTHSRSGTSHEVPAALIKHHYGASNWTSQHARFKHPVYGEVERCLFDNACVNEWDRNVETYKYYFSKKKFN
ncbi:hypothetical protein FDECE_7310 [Fusarium decemcellulare]|nr:hypothetical protein FDECE_7310 [Fusarium decemcellulare]